MSITLPEAEEALRGATEIVLDPKGAWVFDLATREIRRTDGKFYAIRMVDMGGYEAPIVFEEPGIASVEGELREVAHVIIDVAPDGTVKARPTRCADGSTTLELAPSSISKGEVMATRGIGHTCANLKRIDGDIGVHVRNLTETEVTADEAKGERWMSPKDFVEQSRDGRSITALAKAGLLYT